MKTDANENFSIYTRILVEEARRRGIQSKSFADIDRHFALLEYNGHQEYIRQTITSRLNRIAAFICVDKMLAIRILEGANFPVPITLLTENEEEARSFLEKFHKVVVKPLNAGGGKGVTPGIQTLDSLNQAIQKARGISDGHESRVVVQEHLQGIDVRLLVVNYQHFYAVKRIPAQVIGDGHTPIQNLVNQVNQKRLEGRKILITDQSRQLLDEQGLRLDSIPAIDQPVFLSRISNAHVGGTVEDVTETVSAASRELALKAAKYLDIPVLGVDIITSDIAMDPGKIIELNNCPGLTIHHYPDIGTPRNPAADIIDMLFPETTGN